MSYLDSIVFNQYLQPDLKPYEALVADLRTKLKSLSSFKYWQKIHDQHLLLILQNLHLAYQMSPEIYVAYSRNKSNYSKPDAHMAPFKVAYGPTIKIVDGLFDLRLLEGVKGMFYDDPCDPNNPVLAFNARMRGIPLLTNHFPDADLVHVKEIPIERKLIVLRDENKKYIDFVENEETRMMRESVELINRVNRRHFIALCMLDEEFEKVLCRMAGDRYSGRATTDIILGNSEVYRSFCNGTFAEGGRFYGPWWQRLPKEFRKFMRIDNHVIHELDYSCLHSTLLYLEDGLPVPEGDLYEVPGFPPEARKFLKRSMNIILNTKNRESAERTIKRELRKNTEYPPLPEGLSLDRLLNGLVEKHSGIEHYLFKPMGNRLQRLDSDIAEQVMLKLVNQDIPVLALHDSFLVSRLHAGDLAVAMDEAVSERYGTLIKVKPDLTAWDLVFDIGIEDDYFRDVEVYETEAITNLSSLFSRYKRQYQRYIKT